MLVIQQPTPESSGAPAPAGETALTKLLKISETKLYQIEEEIQKQPELLFVNNMAGESPLELAVTSGKMPVITCVLKALVNSNKDKATIRIQIAAVEEMLLRKEQSNESVRQCRIFLVNVLRCFDFDPHKSHEPSELAFLSGPAQEVASVLPVTLFHIADAYSKLAETAESKVATHYPKAAFDHYKRAAQAGVLPAQLRLGESFLRGRGIVCDLDQAVEWLSSVYRQIQMQRLSQPTRTPGVERKEESTATLATAVTRKKIPCSAQEKSFQAHLLLTRGVNIPGLPEIKADPAQAKLLIQKISKELLSFYRVVDMLRFATPDTDFAALAEVFHDMEMHLSSYKKGIPSEEMDLLIALLEKLPDDIKITPGFGTLVKIIIHFEKPENVENICKLGLKITFKVGLHDAAVGWCVRVLTTNAADLSAWEYLVQLQQKTLKEPDHILRTYERSGSAALAHFRKPPVNVKGLFILAQAFNDKVAITTLEELHSKGNYYATFYLAQLLAGTQPTKASAFYQKITTTKADLPQLKRDAETALTRLGVDKSALGPEAAPHHPTATSASQTVKAAAAGETKAVPAAAPESLLGFEQGKAYGFDELKKFQAQAAKNPHALFQVGEAYLKLAQSQAAIKTKAETEAFRCYESSAQTGTDTVAIAAQYRLGECHLHARGTKKNLTQAVQCFSTVFCQLDVLKSGPATVPASKDKATETKAAVSRTSLVSSYNVQLTQADQLLHLGIDIPGLLKITGGKRDLQADAFKLDNLLPCYHLIGHFDHAIRKKDLRPFHSEVATLAQSHNHYELVKSSFAQAEAGKDLTAILVALFKTIPDDARVPAEFDSLISVLHQNDQERTFTSDICSIGMKVSFRRGCLAEEQKSEEEAYAKSLTWCTRLLLSSSKPHPDAERYLKQLAALPDDHTVGKAARMKCASLSIKLPEVPSGPAFATWTAAKKSQAPAKASETRSTVHAASASAAASVVHTRAHSDTVTRLAEDPRPATVV